MATARLVPSICYLANSTYLTVSNESNLYANTDSTTYATITHTRSSTNGYDIYLRGFNFGDIQSGATVTGFSLKLKASATGLKNMAPYMTHGTTGMSSSCPEPTSLPSVLTFTTNSWSYSQISQYGDDFGIRITLKRSNRYNTGYICIYGAEIEVTYTLPTTPRTIITSLTGSGTGTIIPSGSTEKYDGDKYELMIFPTNGTETVTITNGGIDVTSALVPHYQSASDSSVVSYYTYSYTVNGDASIVVNIDEPKYTVVTDLTGDAMLDPDLWVWDTFCFETDTIYTHTEKYNITSGTSYSIAIIPNSKYASSVAIAKNGVDVSSSLVVGTASFTVSNVLGEYTYEEGMFNGFADEYFEGLVGKGVDAVEGEQIALYPGQTEYTWPLSYNYPSDTLYPRSLVNNYSAYPTAIFKYDFDINVPKCGTLTSLYVQVKGRGDVSVRLMCGDSYISNSATFTSTNSVVTVTATSLPDLIDLHNLKFEVTLGSTGGSIVGATCYAVYSLPSYTYTYNVTSNDTITIVVTDNSAFYVKVSGSWVTCSEVYKKINGKWELVVDPSEAFDAGSTYVLSST